MITKKEIQDKLIEATAARRNSKGQTGFDYWNGYAAALEYCLMAPKQRKELEVGYRK